MHDKHRPAKSLITPDDDDTPEMEFYHFSVFPYANQYAGMMLNYAPSPQIVNPNFPPSKHGPQLSGEWWVSHDGFNWSRPFRDVFAPGNAAGIVTHNPVVANGKLLWVIKNYVYGLPEDRLFFAGSMGNAEFSTKKFKMPDKLLNLNATHGFHGERKQDGFDQSYIMVEIRQKDGNVVKGFEKEQCILRDLDGSTMLHWNGKDGTSMAGENVSLRFYIRDARIYSISTG